MLARGPQQPLGVLLALHQGRAVHQRLRGVPYYITHWLFRIDPEQMLQDRQEGDLLRCVLHPHVHRGEHVQVARQVHVMRTCCLCLITFTLLLEHIKLDLEVWIFTATLQVSDYLQQLQPYEFIPESVSILQLRSGDHQTVYKSKEHRSVFVGLSLPEFVHHHAEPIARGLEILIVVQCLQGPAVPLRIVHAEGGQQLEHLPLHLDVGGV